MQSAIPVQERPARNALTAEVSYANHTRKPVARVARSFARLVFPSIKGSTQNLSQRPTGKIGSEKELKGPSGTEPKGCSRVVLNHTLVIDLNLSAVAQLQFVAGTMSFIDGEFIFSVGVVYQTDLS